MGVFTSILVFSCLFGLSAFFSASETAFMATNRLKLKARARYDRRALLVRNILENVESLLGTILICNNLVNVTLSSIATSIAIKIFGETGVLYATLGVTISLLILGEIVPKTVASYHAYSFTMMVAPVVKGLITLLKPILWIINKFSYFLVRITRLSQSSKDASYLSEEELELLIGADRGESTIPKEKQNMLIAVLLMDKEALRDIMIPWRDVVSFDVETSYQEIIDIIRRTNFSRYPVYERDPSNVIGFIHVRDLLLLEDKASFSIRSILRPPSFAPETRTIRSQLEYFKREKTHMTFVIDEYGSIIGLVTLEDVLEEIVGDIEDEHDPRRKDIVELNDGSYLIRGVMLIRDINRQLDIDLPEENVRTIGGLILYKLQRFPEMGEVVNIGRYKLQVVKNHGFRVDLVRLWK